jgi:hypothetical protein
LFHIYGTQGRHFEIGVTTHICNFVLKRSKKYPPTEELENAFPGSLVCFNVTALMPF